MINTEYVLGYIMPNKKFMAIKRTKNLALLRREKLIRQKEYAVPLEIRRIKP